MLGHKKIPAQIVDEKSRREVLEQMFNIHLVREPWQDMPTARALGQLKEDLDRNGEDSSEKRLRDLTGLSIDRVRQLLYVLSLPRDWQDYIYDGTIPLNFFWELKRMVDLLARQRPVLHEDLGGELQIARAFVEKRINGIITDTVGLRKLRPIINFAAANAGDANAPSVLDSNLRDLITNPETSIDDAYEETVQIMVEANKLERRTRSMSMSFERLLMEAHTDQERSHIRTIGKAFIERLSQVLG